MRDVAQNLRDRFAGFVRGHSSGDRAHPGVGVAFIIAALLVLFLGLRWFNDTDEGDMTDDASLAFGESASSGGPTTTIGASPEAGAVRVGTAVPHGADPPPPPEQTVTIGIPGTSIEIELPLSPTTTVGNGGGNGSTGTTRGSGGPTTTRPGHTTTTDGTTQPTSPTTDPPPPTTDPPPPTTEPPTTTEEPPTTTEEPPTTEGSEGLSITQVAGTGQGSAVGALLGALDALL